jgi:hypothetical protein
MDRLKVFVASSSEQVSVAKKVASLLNKTHKAVGAAHPTLDARPWIEETFNFSSTYIESLEKELDRADFAVVIMTADDVGSVRRELVNLPRDNVIFELGLFFARLGRDRCFFFVDATSKTRVASDLSGVKKVDFVAKSGASAGTHDQSLSTRCREVAAQMIGLGERYKPSHGARARQQEIWRFTKDIAGYWWSLRYWDPNRIALVELTPDETMPSVHITGRAFAPDAPNQVTAQWNSVASTITNHEHKWTLYFVWEGFYPSEPDKRFEGSSRYEFPVTRNRFLTGSGRLLEASLKDLRDTKEKAIELRRCSENEVRILQGADNEAKSALFRKQLAAWGVKALS